MKNFKEHVNKFSSVTDDEFERVVKYFTIKKLNKHEVLVREGEPVSHTWWVVEGLLISSFLDADGKEHIIQFANENCWITDQNAFYNREKAILTIVALEDCELLSISFDNREKLCSEFQSMERFFRRKANDSFAKQQKRLLTYLSSDAKKRYDLLLEEYPQLVQRLSKKVLAAYLGVSRETLSRLGK